MQSEIIFNCFRLSEKKANNVADYTVLGVKKANLMLLTF